MLRRYVEYTKIIATVKRKTVSALVYPAILIVAGASCSSAIIVLKVVPAFCGFLRAASAPNCRSSTRVIVGVSDFVRSQFLLIVVGVVGGRGRVRRLGAAAGTEGARSIA